MFGMYLELAKARLSALVLVTTLAGFLLATRGGVATSAGSATWWQPGLGWSWWADLIWTLLGTGLAAAGANALNQWYERRRDALMVRTRRRPLPSGRLTPRHALIWGVAAAMAGVALLAGLVGRLAAGLAFGVVLLYVMVYTPLKTRSTFCTLAGAACGAMPPLIGWAAASGHLPGRAWLLAGILFVWQIPHFFALAWMHRADYERGGFRMLPVVERDGALTFRVLLLFTLVLLPLGLCVTLAGLAGPIFAVGSFVLGGGWLALAVRLYQQRSTTSARRVFWASLLYLPLLLGLMLADRGPPVSGPSGLDPASRPAGAAVSATAEAGGS